MDNVQNRELLSKKEPGKTEGYIEQAMLLVYQLSQIRYIHFCCCVVLILHQ